MNLLSFSLLLSIFIWSIFFETRLLLVYLALAAFYALVGFLYGFKASGDSTRKVSIAGWNDSGDPNVINFFEIDMAAIDQFLDRYNADHPTDKITYTCVFAKALGVALSAAKNFSGKLSFGQRVPCDSVDICVPVNVKDENLLAVVLEQCDKRSIPELNSRLKPLVKELKAEANCDLNEQNRKLALSPAWVIELLVRVSAFVSYDLGWALPFLKVRPNHFGNVLLTNLSGFGLPDTSGRIIFYMRHILTAVINAPRLRPAVVDGRVVKRRIMNFGIIHDARLVSVEEAAELIGLIKKTLQSLDRYL